MGRAVALGDGIYWVGAVDCNIRYFHGPAFHTPQGTTYNAYLIVDQKTALVDTVYYPFAGEMLENIKSVIDPSKLDYLVINHTELDHSSAFPMVLDLCPHVTVLCTQRGFEGLMAYYGRQFKYQIVKTGDTVTLGRRSLKFLEAPMLHWPDSMFTYVPEEGLLLPNDAFGQHLATTYRFDDQADLAAVMDAAAKYYANILLPFSHLVAKKVEEIQNLGWTIKTIAPSHGIIWRQDPGRIMQAYVRWAEGRGLPKAVIAYDTMWGSTEKMAFALLEGLSDEGIDVKVFKVSVSDRNEIIKELLEARALLVGSPTINNDVLPAVSPLLDDLVGLKPKNKLGLAFGAYGWGGGAQKVIEDRLKAAKLQVLEAELTVRWSPTARDLKRCYDLGREIAGKIK